MVGLSMLQRFSPRIPTTAISSLSMLRVIYSITLAQRRGMLGRRRLRLSITLSIWRLIIRGTIIIGRLLSRPTMAIYTRYVTRNEPISHRRPGMVGATLAVALKAGQSLFLDA